MRRRSVVLQGNASSEHPVNRVTNPVMDTLYLGKEYEQCAGTLRQFGYP
jgi:hypothetical protein